MLDRLRVTWIPTILLGTLLAICIAGYVVANKYQVYNTSTEAEIQQLHQRIDLMESERVKTESQTQFIRSALELMERTPSCDLDTNERILVAEWIWKYGTMYDLNPSEWEEDYVPLPYRLLSIAYHESRFRKGTNVVSTAGAKGIMQLMPATFRSCSALLHIAYTNLEDEIFDLERQIQFSAFWIRMLRDDRGDWQLATTAYNCNSCGYMTDYTIKVESLQREVFGFEPIMVD